jgi:hypothetical protein
MAQQTRAFGNLKNPWHLFAQKIQTFPSKKSLAKNQNEKNPWWFTFPCLLRLGL